MIQAYNYRYPVEQFNKQTNPILEKKSEKLETHRYEDEPGFVADITYSPKEKQVKMSNYVRGWTDTNVLYTVNEDGSGAVNPMFGVDAVYPKGTFDEVYKRVSDLSKDGKKISRRNSVEIVKQFNDIARDYDKKTNYGSRTLNTQYNI